MPMIETLNGWGEVWASVIIRGLIDSTVLLAAVSLIWIALRRWMSPALVHGLFLLVLLKLALPFPFDVPRGVAMFSPQYLLGHFAERSIGGPQEAEGRDIRSVLTPDRPITSPVRATATLPARSRSSPSPANVPAVVVATWAPSLTAGLMLASVAVSSILMIGLIRSQWRLQWTLARAEVLDPASLPVDVRELREALGVHREVPILASTAVASPAVCGLFRPRLIVPAGLVEQLMPGQWRWVLLHELAHIRRGDLWVAALERLVQIAYFFHPAVWLACRMLEVQREYACDDAALSASSLPRRDCGAAFLAVVERVCPSCEPTGALLGMSHNANRLRSRLMRILDHDRRVQKCLSHRATVLLITLGLVSVPCVRAHNASDTHPPEPEARQPAEKASLPHGAAGPSAGVAAPEKKQDYPTVPITVTGKATDSAGRPIAGATIYLVSTNGINAPLGITTTDLTGAYTFRDAPLPLRRTGSDSPAQGTFQVFGSADGRGFAWHGMRFYHPEPRPANRRVPGEDHSLFQGEPLVMDLAFPAGATLRGRMVDEAGKPVAGVRISLVHGDYLDTQGRETHHNFREFWCIRQAPESMTTTRTDDDGRFRLEGLPKEVGFRVYVIHPDFAVINLHAATTDRPTDAFDYPRASLVRGTPRPPVSTGDLDLTLKATRQIATRVVYADTGKAAPNVFLGVGGGGNLAQGVSDPEGKFFMRLPPGEYSGHAYPRDKGVAYVRTRTTFTVNAEPAEQSLEVRLELGCVLILEAVDAETGRGIPGVGFMAQMDDPPNGRTSVQSTTWTVDNPRTDADGRLRAVVYPGEREYSMGNFPIPAPYRQEFQKQRASLPAGKTVVVRFELHK
jgi:beta-lactamase regulating signal transducer with metallopeptidase domain/protocatechuate 3,4-dioxygenase beta subunit